MTVHLPENLESSIRDAVNRGQFASVDAAMAEAARLLLETLHRRPDDQEPPSSKPLWEEILELTADLPSEEWDRLPSDLAEQHDHYAYGTPKRPIS